MVTIDYDQIKSEDLNGSYRDLAEILGVEAAIKIHVSCRGTQMFFPMELFSRAFIADRIVKEYNGHNTKELARKYNFTEKWVRKILKDHIDQISNENKGE